MPKSKWDDAEEHTINIFKNIEINLEYFLFNNKIHFLLHYELYSCIFHAIPEYCYSLQCTLRNEQHSVIIFYVVTLFCKECGIWSGFSTRFSLLR